MVVYFGSKLPTYQRTGQAKSASETSGYTFTGVGIGPAANRRLLVIVFGGFGIGVDFVECRVNGVVADVVAATAAAGMVMIVAPAAWGATATIELDFDATASTMLIDVYALYDLRSPTPFDIAAPLPSTSLDLSVDVRPHGIIIGSIGSGSGGPVWGVGLTEDHRDSSDAFFLAAASHQATAAETPRAIAASAPVSFRGFTASFR